MPRNDESSRVALPPRWLNVDAAAAYLCMSVEALYHRVQRRQIPFVRRGRVVRFDRLALDRWMLGETDAKAAR